MGVFPILAHHPDQPCRRMGWNQFPEPSLGPRDCCVCSKRPNHRKSSSYQCNTCKASLCLHLCMHIRTIHAYYTITHTIQSTYTSSHTTRLRTQALSHYKATYVHKLSHTTRLHTQTLSLCTQAPSHYKATPHVTRLRTQALSCYKATYTSSITLQGYVHKLTHYKATYTSSLMLQGYVHKLSHYKATHTSSLTLQGYVNKLSHYKAKRLSHTTSLRIHKSSSLVYPEGVVYKRERDKAFVRSLV